MKRLVELFYYPHTPHKGFVRIQTGRCLQPRPAYYHCFGLLVNWKSFWIGGHYSEHHKRLCVNIVPCITIWWTKPGGYLP